MPTFEGKFRFKFTPENIPYLSLSAIYFITALPALTLNRRAAFQNGTIELEITVVEGPGRPSTPVLILSYEPSLLHWYYDNALAPAERAQLHQQVLGMVGASARAELAEYDSGRPQVRAAVCKHLRDTVVLMVVSSTNSMQISMTHEDFEP